ncbi:hypothetical protein SLS60_010091 [Paraconiothyrium brasiliense]|uniref:Uncharacterized protein n=1 Tax=Paraconiothyrium brasiliense TaxID=300254 RepID=A0ABR3QQA5_9PLEO
MKLPLALFALISCSASALVPDTQVETETPPKAARLAKRDWPKFVEHLRDMQRLPLLLSIGGDSGRSGG